MKLPGWLRRRPRDERILTVVVLPHGAARLSRSWELPYRRLRWCGIGGITLVVLLLLMVGSWYSLASQAAQVPLLRRKVARLEQERRQMADLDRKLREVEARYEQMRDMLGATGSRSGLYLPPAAGSQAAESTPNQRAGQSRSGQPRNR